MTKLILFPFLAVLLGQLSFSQNDSISNYKKYLDKKYILDLSKSKEPYNPDSIFGLSYYSQEPIYRKSNKFNPKQIYSLDFYHENSTFVSLDWTQFTELREVRLNLEKFYSDKIATLISSNPNLEVLTLYFNDTLPSCICELEHLTELNLVNKATALNDRIFPDCFGKLSSLKTLRFYGNNQSFDASSAFWKPENLEHIYLDNVKNVDVSPESDKLISFWVQNNWSVRFSDKFFLSKELEYLNILTLETFNRAEPEYLNEKSVYPADSVLSNKFEQFEKLKGVAIHGVFGQNHFPSFDKSRNLEYIDFMIDSRMKFEQLSNKKQLKFFELGSIDGDFGKTSFPLDSISYSALKVLHLENEIADDFFPSYFLKSQQLNELFLVPFDLSIKMEIKILSIPSLKCVSPTRAEYLKKLTKDEQKRQLLYKQKSCDEKETIGYQLTKEFQSNF